MPESRITGNLPDLGPFHSFNITGLLYSAVSGHRWHHLGQVPGGQRGCDGKYCGESCEDPGNVVDGRWGPADPTSPTDYGCSTSTGTFFGCGGRFTGIVTSKMP
jgi:hypothetical protein